MLNYLKKSMTGEKNLKRNKILDCYKGVLIILVIIRHALQYSTTDEGGIISNFIWAVQMPGFMLVSGFFAYRSKEAYSVLSVVHKSLYRYLLPFLSWFVLITVFLLGEYNRNVFVGLKNLTACVDNGLWFLWCIFVFSIFIIPINIMINNISSKRLVISYSFIFCYILAYYSICLFILKYKGSGFLGVKFLIYYSLFYGIGFLIRAYKNFFVKFISKNKSLLFTVCLVVFSAIIYNIDLYKADDTILNVFIRFVAGICGNFIIIGIIARYKELLEKWKLDFIGKYTLEIYVVSSYLSNMMVRARADSFFSAIGFLTFLISIVLTTVATIIIIVTIKLAPTLNFIMFGKKRNGKI